MCEPAKWFNFETHFSYTVKETNKEYIQYSIPLEVHL